MDDLRPYRRAFRLERAGETDARAAVDEEIAHHLEERVEELVEEGWTPGTARDEALREFGDVAGTRDYCVDMQVRHRRAGRRGIVVEQLAQDLRHALRGLRRTPGYTLVVVSTLAFGIAANATIVSLINPYFLRALPYGDADRLVHVTQVDPVNGWDMDRFSLPTWADWRARNTGFEDLAAYYYGPVNVTGPEGPEAVPTSFLTSNMFDVLDADAALGRTFREDEGGPGGRDVVVLSHGLWQRRYAGDPAILGRAISLDGTPFTVIGVMPPAFTFPFNGIKMWTPVRDDVTAASRDRAPLLFVGRLRDGWTAERVDAELTGIQSELAILHPDTDGRWRGVTVKPMREALNFGWAILRVSFGVLLGAVALVLALACVNVAGLTLARGATRVRETAVRSALGASRSRIVRQMLTESVVLAVAGGALGIGLSHWAARLVAPLLPDDLYRVGDVSVDPTVVAFAAALALATPLLFGALPALRATRRDLVTGLKEGTGGSVGTSFRLRRVLVAVQVGLAVVLTTGAGLMLRSLSAAQSLDLGFDAAHTLTAEVRPPAADDDPTALSAYVEEASARLAGLPGVRGASAVRFLPLNHETALWQFAPTARSDLPAAEWANAIVNWAHPGYFETMGIPLISGRDFGAMDGPDEAPTAVVSRALADRWFDGRDPSGATLLVGNPSEPTEVRVIGVVGGVRHDGLAPPGDRAQIWLSALRTPARRVFLVARVDGDPSALVPAARAALAELDPTLPLVLRPMRDIVRENLVQWTLGSGFLLVLGTGALLLATLGIYGLIAFTVAERRRELGVRIALGASGSDVRRAVVGDGVRLTALGVVGGVVVALALGKLADSILFGVTGSDPLTLAAVAVLFLAVAVVASIVPARRAMRTDPIRVLRAE